MIQDAEKIRDGTVLDADICIIGAGPAGITLAKTLAETPASIIWLESGGLHSETSAQTLNDGIFIGAPYAGLRQTRHRQLGGTANCWNTPLCQGLGAKYVPLDDCDFEPRGDAQIGWPFGRAHLENFYQRAQSICGLGPFFYEKRHWQEALPTFLIPDPRVHTSIYQFGPATVFTGSPVQTVPSYDGLRFLYHATVCALRSHGSERAVEAVVVSTLAGNRFRINAKIVILAAGAVENARLLLVSRESGHAAPGNQSDWLGRCFMEHPRDYSMSLIPKEGDTYANAAFYDRHVAGDGTEIGGRIGLDPDMVARDGLINGSLTLLPLLRRDQWYMGRLRRGLARLRISAAPEISRGYGWSQTPDPQRHYRGFRLLLNAEQLPHPDNRVVLSGDSDRLGVPRAEVRWRWRPADQRRLERIRYIFAGALRSGGLGRIDISGRSSPDPNAHHHSGTTRMHEDPRLGVVDADSRVHGTSNLYVAGSSVFPAAGYANPTLTIVALALRLADHIKQRL